MATAVLVAACGTDTGPDVGADPTDAGSTGTPSGSVSSSPGPTGSATPEDEPSGGLPPFPTDTAAQVVQPEVTENGLVLTDIQVASHEGYDRIVMSFSGTGTPGWSVEYVDEAIQEGSGDAVALGGDTVLSVFAAGTTYPAEDAPDDSYYDGPQQFEPPDGGRVVDVYSGGTFEGYSQLLVGLEGEATPFRVFALENPSRLVVDVADAG